MYLIFMDVVMNKKKGQKVKLEPFCSNTEKNV